MSLLAIDIGNTRTKFGVFSQNALVRTWNVATAEIATVDAAGHILASLPPGTTIGVCSVVATHTTYFRDAARQQERTCILLSGQSPTPLRNRYHTPDMLGTDRLMAAVAAVQLCGAPVIPICLGTATVVDAVSAQHEYLGGMIAPGVGTAMQGLAHTASALYPITWQHPASAIGCNTDQALISGLYYQTLGGIRAMIDAVRDALGVAAPIVLSGGWAAPLQTDISAGARYEPHLILHGIAVTVRHMAYT